MHAFYDEMLKFSTLEDVEALPKALGTEITDVQERAEEWGSYLDGKFKEHLLVDEFENLFIKVTEDIKEQEANLRAKTSELEDTVREMRMAVYNRPRSRSSASKTNTQSISENGILAGRNKTVSNEKRVRNLVKI